MQIRPAREDERLRLAHLAALWNRDIAQRCLHADETPAAVEATWRGWQRPLAESTIVAEARGEIVGVLSFDIDSEQRRAWLFGPFGQPNGWNDIARALLEAFESRHRAAVTRVHNFLDERATRSLAVHQALLYALHGERVHVLQIMPRRIGDETTQAATAADRAALEALHQSAFPDTHTSMDHIFARAAAGESLRICRIDGYVAGYVYTYATPELNEATLQYIAVAPEFRGRGLGRRLVQGSLHWAFDQRQLGRVLLTVFDGNAAARALYEREGFQPEYIGVPIEKRLS